MQKSKLASGIGVLTHMFIIMPLLPCRMAHHFRVIIACQNGCILYYTSAKIIQLNEYGCRDAPCEKSWKQGNPLSNTIKDTSTIMRNPLPELCREGLRMIVLVSLIVLLRGFPCFHDFSHGASIHPYSFS